MQEVAPPEKKPKLKDGSFYICWHIYPLSPPEKQITLSLGMWQNVSEVGKVKYILGYPGVSIFRGTLATMTCLLFKHAFELKFQTTHEWEKIVESGHSTILKPEWLAPDTNPTLLEVGKLWLPPQSPCSPSICFFFAFPK